LLKAALSQVSSLHKLIFKIRNAPFYCQTGLEFVDSSHKYITANLIALHYDSAQCKICSMHVVKYSMVPKIFPTEAILYESPVRRNLQLEAVPIYAVCRGPFFQQADFQTTHTASLGFRQTRDYSEPLKANVTPLRDMSGREVQKRYISLAPGRSARNQALYRRRHPK
jgi:hypothetical protein